MSMLSKCNICGQQEMHLTSKDTHRLKVKEWKKKFQASGAPNQAGTAILISEKVGFNIKFI
jgi:hypothetical protein